VSRPSLLLFVGVPVALSMAVVWACSTGEHASPISPAFDGSVIDASFDRSVIPDAGPRPTCTMVDIAPGAGKKFCELPGVDTPDLQVPPGFCAREFTTTPVMEARVLRFAPNGDLFVAVPSMLTPGGAADGVGAIVVLPDDDGDGRELRWPVTPQWRHMRDARVRSEEHGVRARPPVRRRISVFYTQ